MIEVNPALLFPLIFLGLLMVAYIGFGKTVIKWLWEQKFLLAFMVAGSLTMIELLGAQTVFGFLPMMFQMAFQLLFAMVFMVVQFGAMMWIMSRPRVTWYQPGELDLTFDDYVGNPVVKQLLEEAVANIQTNNTFAKMGGSPSRGILLSGPPGTGKSYGGRVVAGVCKVPFCLVDAASLQSAFMGMGSMTVNNLYRKAKKYARKHGACIVFLDELDAVGGARSRQGTGMGMMGGMMMGGGASLLNTLLTNLDPPPADQTWTAKLKRKLGFPVPPAGTPYVLTMGATNLPESLDQALVRDGRMDLTIVVDLPDVNGRVELFRHELKKITTDPELNVSVLKTAPDSEQANIVRANLRKLALQTGGWSPASIKTIVTNKAVAEAARNGHAEVTFADIVAARRTKSFDVKQPLLSMTDKENRRIAYHEGGHAFIGLGRRHHMTVEYATIIRRGNALGLVASAYENERHTVTKSELIADIDVSLGSRAVEIEILGDEMSGFSGDLSHATHTAAMMISMYGMDDELVSMAALGATSVPKGKVNRLLQKRMAIVRALVRKHRPVVEAISELLLEKKEVDGDELYALFGTFFPDGILDVEDPEVLAIAQSIEDEYVREAKANAEFMVAADVVLAQDGEKGKKAPFSLPDGTVATAESLGQHGVLSCCRIANP